MASELTQTVEILGRLFHVRTRRTEEAGLSVRTEVLLDDKVVATRESCFERRRELDGGVALAWMKEQHRRVFEMFIARALRYQAREAPAGDGAAAAPYAPSFEPIPTPPPAEPPAEAADAPPSASRTPELTNALRVRRFFGSFSTLIGPPTRTPPADVERRLGEAAEAFEWMIRSSLFAEIRLDEQVRCHLLKDRIDGWLSQDRHAGDRGAGAASRIWSEILTFNNYLSEVNHRAELVAFDRRMLRWALGEVRRRGMSAGVREQLAWLHGLLPRLNSLLDHPDGVSDAAWIGQLEIALALTDPLAESGSSAE